jgi:hypothetical protein
MSSATKNRNENNKNGRSFGTNSISSIRNRIELDKLNEKLKDIHRHQQHAFLIQNKNIINIEMDLEQLSRTTGKYKQQHQHQQHQNINQNIPHYYNFIKYEKNSDLSKLIFTPINIKNGKQFFLLKLGILKEKKRQFNFVLDKTNAFLTSLPSLTNIGSQSIENSSKKSLMMMTRSHTSYNLKQFKSTDQSLNDIKVKKRLLKSAPIKQQEKLIGSNHADPVENNEIKMIVEECRRRLGFPFYHHSLLFNKEIIDSLKKKDPIYAKRMKQVQFMKTSDKFVPFDHQADAALTSSLLRKSFSTTTPTTKKELARHRDQLINKSTKQTAQEKKRNPDAEINSKLNERVDYFVKNFQLVN